MGITPEQARRELARRKALKAAQQATAEAPPAPEPAAEEPSALARFGRAHIDGAKALLTGAGVGAAMGKDDDLAGTAAALGAATQQDMDAGNPMVALRRVLGTAAPAFVPGLGIAGEVASRAEQYLADKAAPGARESATLGQRAKVAKSFEESPILTGAGVLAGGALTGGASAAAPVKGVAPTVLRRAAAAFPSGFVTGYEGKDDGNMQERLGAGLGGGVLSAGLAGAAPAVLGAAERGLDKAWSATRSVPTHAIVPKPVTAAERLGKMLDSYENAPGLVKGAANAKLSGAPAVLAKAGRFVQGKMAGPAAAPKNAPDVSAYAGGTSSADDALMQKMTGGADLVDDLAASADDVAEDAPIVLRKRINPVGPEDVVDDVAPRAAPVPDNTPTPRPMTPAEMEAAISRLPSRGQTPRPSALDDELEAVGAGLREGTPVPLEGADVDPFVTPPAREPTLRQRNKTPTPAPAPALRQRKPDAPRKLQGPPDTFQGAAEATPEELAASMARMQSSRVMPDVEPVRQPLPDPDFMEGIGRQSRGGAVTPLTPVQVRAAGRSVTYDDFADKVARLPSGQRAAALDEITRLHGKSFADEVATRAGTSNMSFDRAPTLRKKATR